jgi:hypothetical protein
MHRIGFISANAFRQAIVSLANMAIPFLVIGCCQKEIWGSFVSLLLFNLLALQFINWGSKEFLLRQFSEKPGKIADFYSQVLFTRWPLILLFGVIGFFLYPIQFGWWIFIWILGRYFNHSAEALVIYEKQFGAAIVIEVIAFGGFCLGLFFLKSDLNLLLLLILYSFYQFGKGLCYFLLFYRFIAWADLKMNLDYYRTSFSFFLLSILGFLASKIDVYIVENLGDKVITSDYQVINSLLVFAMSLSAFLYAPFIKNIYRNTELVILKIKKRVAVVGLILVPVALLVVYFILTYALHLSLAFSFYIVAFCYVYPCFIYGIDIIHLFKQHQEKQVVWYLLAGAISNTMLSGLFLHFGYGITGALFGSALAQIFVLLLLRFKCFQQ